MLRPMALLPHRRLGSSELQVSLFSLGSWRTFERISREQGLDVMQAARDAGITFLDDARYNDETGAAPIATGWSEVVFGELFRAAGWVRDEVTVANKLWWEFWPDQDATAELDGSLGRMGLGHVDLIYSMPPPEGMDVADLVAQVAALIASGRARSWGIGNWQPDVLADADIGLVASYVFAGGTLTGKYLQGQPGRAAADHSATAAAARQRAEAVVQLAHEWDVSPASLAFSFALGHPRLASVLFGATGPEQLRQNVASLDVFASLDEQQRRQLDQLAAS